ncbi:hypothetical protein C8T65DRAFT_576452 [Cerioporus squamosus]|nr:hypothetical protein C8T65DRAFT_576452 [Cerioporus squamosus]
MRLAGPAKGAVEAFEGLVVGPGFSDTSVFTTPNQLHVPQFAIAHNEIITYSDGRWGLHEYSRWPQEYDRAYIHVACIPRKGAHFAPASEIVWRTWQRDDWEADSCGVARLSMLKRSLTYELERAAERAIDGVYARMRQRVQENEVVMLLVLCLRQCLDRLRLLPSECSVIISLAAHVQRLVLELAGVEVYLEVVLERITSKRNYRFNVLDVVGAYTSDASSAQLLHRIGIPVWFQQHLTPLTRFWGVARLTTLPIAFSSVPSYPRLVLAVRDLSGALNTPGEWQRAMHAIVRRQLCASRLPELIVAEDDDDERVPSKYRKPLPSTPRDSNRCRSFTMNPFRQHYESFSLTHSHAWATALEGVGPLSQPSKSVKYFLPPPWLLDRLRGYPVSGDKLTRYMHHWLSIRKFCRIRLFDRTILGRPLTILEWRDALWGDYSVDASDGGDMPEPSTPEGTSDRMKRRHQLKQSMRLFFGNVAALPSYDPANRPGFDGLLVSPEMVSDDGLRGRVVWELHESNWRCELLALDAVMVGSNDWPELLRWTREVHISEVWGPPRSGLNVAPDVDVLESPAATCWPDPADEDWTKSRGPLRAFVDLLTRWKTCPSDLRIPPNHLESCGRAEFGRIQSKAVAFYVKTFVDVFERLPIPPVHRPAARNVVGPL